MSWFSRVKGSKKRGKLVFLQIWANQSMIFLEKSFFLNPGQSKHGIEKKGLRNKSRIAALVGGCP